MASSCGIELRGSQMRMVDIGQYRNAYGGYRPIEAVEEWSAGGVCLHAVHHTQTRPQHHDLLCRV